MAFHYSDGSYVGGCGAQIGGVVAIAAVFGLYSLGIGIGLSLLIVIVATIIIMVLFNQLDNPTNKREIGKSYYHNGKYGFLDINGYEVRQPIFDKVNEFSEGFVGVKFQNKWGFLDKYGKTIVDYKYDACGSFHQGVAAVAKDGKWGFINTKGKERIKLLYDQVMDFEEASGFAAVCKDGKWGLINIKGRVIVPFDYQGADSTHNGEAFVYPFNNNSIRYRVNNDGKITEEIIN